MADSVGSKAPDLTLGVAVDSLSSGGTLLGRVGDDDVLLARAGDRFFAVGAHCTRLRWIHLPAGASSAAAQWCSCGRKYQSCRQCHVDRPAPASTPRPSWS